MMEMEVILTLKPMEGEEGRWDWKVQVGDLVSFFFTLKDLYSFLCVQAYHDS